MSKILEKATDYTWIGEPTADIIRVGVDEINLTTVSNARIAQLLAKNEPYWSKKVKKKQTRSPKAKASDAQ